MPVPIVLPEIPAPDGVVSNETLRFDYPGSDIILRSCDSQDFRVPKLYVVNSSPVLRELIQTVPNTSGIADSEEQNQLPVVKLPEGGAILHSLFSFIFPVAPILPSTTENIMALFAVAQKYQMDPVLTHIRGVVSLQDPPFILPETALHIYSLAQKYELRQETLRAARSTLRLSMTIEDLEDKIDFMPGAYLRELWNYHERVRKDLAPSLLEFRKSGVPNIMGDLRCGTPPAPLSNTPNPIPQPIPQWLGDYIESLAQAPHLFDLVEFENALARHIKGQPQHSTICPCVGISGQTIRAFWEALTTVIHRTIEKVRRTGVASGPHRDNECEHPQLDSTLALVKEGRTSENLDPPFPLLCWDITDANIILRSSDQVDFRVCKSVLAMSSPFFKDLLSLPQPPDDELIDGLPVIQLSEDASLLDILVSLLYPTSPVIPSSYEKVFALLAACQKYDMASVQSTVRAAIKLGTFPAPVEAEAFSAYAIASSLGLVPEMESTARLTLGYPMTFEFLGEGLRSFEGRALCDLVRYRKRCRDHIVSSLDSFFTVRSRYQMWAGCREPSVPTPNGTPLRDAPTAWLGRLFSSKNAELKNGFTHAISSPATILEEYRAALKNHAPINCASCFRVHAMEGETFRRELEDQLTQALDKVNTSSIWIAKPTDLNSRTRCRCRVLRTRSGASRAGSKSFRRFGYHWRTWVGELCQQSLKVTCYMRSIDFVET